LENESGDDRGGLGPTSLHGNRLYKGNIDQRRKSLTYPFKKASILVNMNLKNLENSSISKQKLPYILKAS
jgi:hypothetical protein